MRHALLFEWRKHRTLVLACHAAVLLYVSVTYATHYASFRSFHRAVNSIDGIDAASRSAAYRDDLVLLAPKMALDIGSALIVGTGFGTAIIIVMIVAITVREFGWRTIGHVLSHDGRWKRAAVVNSSCLMAATTLLVTAWLASLTCSFITAELVRSRVGIDPSDVVLRKEVGVPTIVGGAALIMAVTCVVTVCVGLLTKSRVAGFLLGFAVQWGPGLVAHEVPGLWLSWVPSLVQARVQEVVITYVGTGVVNPPLTAAPLSAPAAMVVLGATAVLGILVAGRSVMRMEVQ